MAIITPQSLTTALWLDAADTATVLEEAGGVSQWLDKSGNERHLVQAVSTRRPVFNPTSSGVEFTRSGATVTSFDGASNMSLAFGALSTYPFAVFAVVSERSGTAPAGIVLGYTTGSTSYASLGAEGFMHRNSTAYYTAIPYDGGDLGPFLIQYRATATTARNGSKNAGTDASSASSSAALGTGGNTYLGLDRAPSGTYPANAFTGTIHEIVVVTETLTLEDRQIIEGYLAHKWGFNSDLPITHPYYEFPPDDGSMEVNDTLALSDTNSNDIIEQEVGDALFLADEVLTTTVANSFVADTLTLTDAQDSLSYMVVEDTLSFSEAAQESRDTVFADTLRLRGQTNRASEQLVADTLALTDSQAAVSDQLVSETLGISDAHAQATASTKELSAHLRLRDGIDTARSDEVSDTLGFSETVRHESVQVVSDTLAFSELVQQTALLPGDEISDTLSFSDAAQTQAVAMHEVSDRFALADTYIYKDPTAIAWVMNTETGAPYWYSNWQFAHMTQAGNRVFAVGPEGLVELGADTDNGEEIDAGVTYGFMDMGAEQKKRVDGFWFGYAADGRLSVSVETYGQGYPIYAYEMERRAADSPRNNRVIPGKGLNARYWRIGIDNIGGCDFAVDSIAADLAVSARRI